MIAYKDTIVQDGRRIWLPATCALLIVSTMACADTIFPNPSPNPHELVYRFSVEPRALTLAKDSTFRLQPTVINILGDEMAIPDSTPVQYRSLMPEQVTVNAAGVVTGVDTTSSGGEPNPVSIITSWTYRGVTKADTSYVVVTAATPPHSPARLSLQRALYPQDSTWIGVAAFFQRQPVAVLDTMGDTLSQSIVYLWTDRRREGVDDLIKPVSHYLTLSVPAGTRFWVHGAATVYGVTLRDSVQYLITDGVFGMVSLGQELGYVFLNQTAKVVSPCAQLFFQNSTDTDAQVVFETPEFTSKCLPSDETGNIAHIPPGGSVVRKFRTPGTYQWHIRRADGTSFVPAIVGSIRVRDRSEL